ncbi:MAG: hypothetical protein ACTS2F_13410 [Thainema sp.]
MTLRNSLHHILGSYRSSQRLASTLLLGGFLTLSVGEQAGFAAVRSHLTDTATRPELIAKGRGFPMSQRNRMIPASLEAQIKARIRAEYDINPSRLRVSEAERETWSDSCLGLGGPAEICAFVMTPGWRVTMTAGDSTWIYRTDESGNSIRLESTTFNETPNNSDRPNGRLPNQVERRVYEYVAQEAGTSRLRITNSSAEEWPDMCLGVPNPVELCAPAVTPGWRVTVTDGDEEWTVRTNANATEIRLEPEVVNSGLPDSIRDRIFERVYSENDVIAVQVFDASQETWSDSCLGLGQPYEGCLQALVPGWRVEVTDGQRTWIYRTDETGDSIRLEEQTATSQLPEMVETRVLEAAAAETGQPASQFTITDFTSRTWDGCMGVASPMTACTMIAISGWQVVITDQTQTWIYHTNFDGTDIRLNDIVGVEQADVTIQIMPDASLPQPIEEEIFRVSMSGGFAGMDTATVLLANGRVIQYAAGPNQPETRTVLTQVSPAAIAQFQDIVASHQLNRFHRLNYQPTHSVADTFTVTVSTAMGGVTQYDDSIAGQLPDDLQAIMQAWQNLTTATR